MEVKQELKDATEHKVDQKQRDRTRRNGRQQTAPDSFRGKHKDLQGWIYLYDTAARAYQYNKTTEAITDWVKMNLKFPMDIWRAMTTLKEPDQNKWKPKLPKSTDADTKAVDDKIFDQQIKKYMERISQYDENNCNVFTIVYGQCDNALQAKLRGQDNWEEVFERNNLVQLMISIKKWLLNQEGSRCPIAATDATIAAMYKVRQNRHETLTEYKKRFSAVTEVLEHINVSIGKALVALTDKALKADYNVTRTAATGDQVKQAEKKTLNKYLACRFIAGADRARFANVSIYLENEFIAGSDKWPEDVTAAYNFLENWRQRVTNVEAPPSDGASFAQGSVSADGSERSGPTKAPKDRSKMRCYGCGKLGHIKPEGKCKPKDIKEWQATTNHMTMHTENGDEGSDDEGYQVTMCMTPPTRAT